MSRVEENRETVEDVIPLLNNPVGAFDERIRNTLLIDISKSLAVLADNLEEQTKWFKDFEEENNDKHGEKKATHGDD
jgi:hypothetical protein